MDPRYREVTATQIPTVKTAEGATVRIICGRVGDIQGPVREIVTDPEYLDVSLPAGDTVLVTTEKKPVRFLLVSGKPLREPVAWYGPIVMNTKEELRTAFEEFEAGTFIKGAALSQQR
jgi:hypothetical protein